MAKKTGGIYAVGDTHRDFFHLNAFIKDKRPELILQVGDFGYWPRLKSQITPPAMLGGRLLFCDGNHEDHKTLGGLSNREVYPGCFHMPRGTVETLPDGRNVLFLGGALSIDKDMRTPDFSWFEEEVLTERDIERIPDVPVDIVVSHTCPLELIPSWATAYNDFSCKVLSHIWQTKQPRWWYYGHWHEFRQVELRGCVFTCLNRADIQDTGGPWWTPVQ